MPIMCFHQTCPFPSLPVPSCFCRCSFLSTSRDLSLDPRSLLCVVCMCMGEEHLLQPGRPPGAASLKKPAFLPIAINCQKLLSQGQGFMGPSPICIRIFGWLDLVHTIPAAGSSRVQPSCPPLPGKQFVCSHPYLFQSFHFIF